MIPSHSMLDILRIRIDLVNPDGDQLVLCEDLTPLNSKIQNQAGSLRSRSVASRQKYDK